MKRSGASSTIRRRGQALVELAFVMMALLLLSAGALDLGRVWYGSIGITNAAREGALEAAANPGSFQAGRPCDPTTNRIICRVIGEAAGASVTIAPDDVTVVCDPAPCPAVPTWGDTVTVTVTGHLDIITPFLAAITGPTLTIRASASVQLTIAP